ncbi:hypothetical protein BDR06DRAFT_1037728, partial [Suillus hirtellus]
SLPAGFILHILSFLLWQDIIRCTSLCKSLREIYMSSSELQYITELGGQQLLPVLNGSLSVSERLQLLRDKVHAWSKFDVHSSESISIPVQFRRRTKVSVVNGHACFWKPTMHSGLAIVYATVVRNDGLVYDEAYCIDLVALDGDCTHPQAAGRTLFLSDLPKRKNFVMESTKIEGFGRHIALRLFDDQLRIPSFTSRWWLQIWDWQQSTTSKCILSGPIVDPDFNEIDICFLGNNRFLVINDDLKLYSIEDMSHPPLLLACFLLPTSVMNLRCLTPTDDIARSPHPSQATWISDPKHRLISLVTWNSELYFIISTRIFFEPDFVDQERTKIPWESWGPSNAHVVPHLFSCKLSVSGSRALYAFASGVELNDGLIATEYRIHLMDFSPSAVKRHHEQGLGRMMNKPSKVENVKTDECITTSMSYVEVVSHRTFIHGKIILSSTYFNYSVYQIFAEADVPAGVIQFVLGLPPEVVPRAVSHPNFCFTCSTFIFKKRWKDPIYLGHAQHNKYVASQAMPCTWKNGVQERAG